MHVKGLETSMGYVGWLGTFQGKKGTELEKRFESEIVKDLHACGAVLFCKTSVPHTLMSGETMNNITGYCWNPRNRNLSAGGSSGGEGALIALHGSPLGFGTDIGGSIRIPAAFGGLYALRPSAGRLPYEGMANSMDGQNTILSVVGPLATSIESLRLSMRALLSRQPWLHDPMVHEIPWRDDRSDAILKYGQENYSSGGLAFSVLRHDGEVTPHPPIRRALEVSVKSLELAGHQVIEWKPLSHKRIVEIVQLSWGYDGGKDVREAFALSGEPMSEQVNAFGEVRKEQTASFINKNNVRKREMQKAYLDYWNSTAVLTKTKRPVDAVVSPAAPIAAARPEMFHYLGYSNWVNLLDYTAVTVPVTDCDKNIDVADQTAEPATDLNRAVWASYDAEIYHGARVGVQLVGKRLQEERVLAIAEVLDKALKIGGKSS